MTQGIRGARGAGYKNPDEVAGLDRAMRMVDPGSCGEAFSVQGSFQLDLTSTPLRSNRASSSIMQEPLWQQHIYSPPLNVLSRPHDPTPVPFLKLDSPDPKPLASK